MTSQSTSTRLHREISKTWRYASELYLTRRFDEALRALEPLVLPRKCAEDEGDGAQHGLPEALIGRATTSQRIKVWALYLSVLSSILDLSYEEGKKILGNTEFQEVATEVSEGGIWERVVRHGYGGKEGGVDAEVIYNLYIHIQGIWRIMLTSQSDSPP